MSNLWRCLESIGGLVGVPAVWRARLNSDFDRVRTAFLRKRDESAQSYPCSSCGCAHEVVKHDDGQVVAVCRCEPCSCGDISLKVEDLALLELNWQKLGRAVAAALGCDRKEAAFGLPQTAQVAAFSGAALPIVLTIQTGTSAMQSVVGQLVAKLRERFAVLAPTSRFVDAHVRSMLTNAKARFFDLESHLKLTAAGAFFQASKSACDLFSSLVADAKEPASDDVASSSDRRLKLGKLRYLPDFNDVWLDDEHYDLRSRQKARLCLQYLVENQAFDADSARHFTKEIDPYVRTHGNYPRSADPKIDHYFNDSDGKLPALRRALIQKSGRRDGRYFLKAK
jgi:hypothetical protein